MDLDIADFALLFYVVTSIVIPPFAVYNEKRKLDIRDILFSHSIFWMGIVMALTFRGINYGIKLNTSKTPISLVFIPNHKYHYNFILGEAIYIFMLIILIVLICILCIYIIYISMILIRNRRRILQLFNLHILNITIEFKMVVELLIKWIRLFIKKYKRK